MWWVRSRRSCDLAARKSRWCSRATGPSISRRRAACGTTFRCTSARIPIRFPSTRRRPSFRCTWWIALRSLTGKACTVNRDWTIRITTFALPCSAAPRWAWPVTCFAPTSSIATTGRPAWCRPTCAPRSPPTPPFWAAARSSRFTTWATRDCFRKRHWRRSALDPSVYRPDGMEFFGRVSYIKAGIEFADALSTVSPTYAREIQTPELGFGLDARLRERANVLTGILNGVDYTEWSPQTDPNIPAHYSIEDLGGKAICKRKLLEEFGLPAEAMDRPLLGVVSRFTRQKGTDILAEIAGADCRRRRVSGGAGDRRPGVRGVLPPHAGGASRADCRAYRFRRTGWRTASRPGRTSS